MSPSKRIKPKNPLLDLYDRDPEAALKESKRNWSQIVKNIKQNAIGAIKDNEFDEAQIYLNSLIKLQKIAASQSSFKKSDDS